MTQFDVITFLAAGCAVFLALIVILAWRIE